MDVLQPISKSWSELTWQQLCQAWSVKQRYGGNADVARAAALLALTVGSKFATSFSRSARDTFGIQVSGFKYDEQTGEKIYLLRPEAHTVTARELAYYAKQTLMWFDYPYGDPGDEEEKDDKGKVIKERREPVRGYVGPMHDALALPCDYVSVSGFKVQVSSNAKRSFLKPKAWNLKPVKHFALPQVACNNLTWQQYRSLQAIVPQLFNDDISDEQAVQLQAQFLSHCLVPRSFALMDSSGKSIKIRPHWVYEYDTERAEHLVVWWKKRLKPETSVSILFHICFQVYQTAVGYYSQVFPLLFSESGNSESLQDALTGEVNTINSIMKYQGYTDPQQVYDTNLPIILGVLNNMTKEAKEIEKMNAKMKKK